MPINYHIYLISVIYWSFTLDLFVEHHWSRKTETEFFYQENDIINIIIQK